MRKWVKPRSRVRRATISFGSAIKAAARHEYMGNPSSEVFWEQDTTYCTPCLCLLCGRGSRPWLWDKFIPLLPPLWVTFLTNLTISDDLVCYSASVFPTRSDMDPVLSGTFNSGQTWVLPLDTWVSPKTTADHAQSKVHQKVQNLGCGVTHHIASLIWKILASQYMFASTSLSSCPHCLEEQFFQYLCVIAALRWHKRASFWTY